MCELNQNYEKYQFLMKRNHTIYQYIWKAEVGIFGILVYVSQIHTYKFIYQVPTHVYVRCG